MVDVSVLFEAGSGFLLVGLGVLVLLVRPRRRPAVAFAMFSILWGMDAFLSNTAFVGLDGFELVLYAATVAQVGAAASLVWLTTMFPRSATRRERGAFWAAGVVGAAIALVLTLGIWLARHRFPELEPTLYSTGLLAFVLTYPIFLGALLYAIVLWTLRYIHVPDDDGRARRQYALAAAALVSWVGFVTGHGPSDTVSIRIGIQSQDGFILLLTGLPMLILLGVAATWLYAQHAAPDGRIGRNMAWFVLSVLLLGVLYSYVEPWGAFALTRLLATALLAIGILRFQMLSLDVKIRWTVSRSTVAAAFIVVFFAASEGAQAFFGDQFQNEYLGIAAAAFLVVALVPLQRVADRVALRAVPGSGAGLFRPQQLEKAYRDAVRLALRDHAVTPEEEVQLAELADALGISAARAMRIRQEVGAQTEP